MCSKKIKRRARDREEKRREGEEKRREDTERQGRQETPRERGKGIELISSHQEDASMI
jgi:hypothetical protein